MSDLNLKQYKDVDTAEEFGENDYLLGVGETGNLMKLNSSIIPSSGGKAIFVQYITSGGGGGDASY